MNPSDAGRLAAGTGLAACLLGLSASAQVGQAGRIADGPFTRIATFPIFENESIDTETVSEIVASANRGRTLVYTDSEQNTIGFVDLTDPSNPVADGTVALSGEPTSVAVRRRWVLACANTSADFVNTSGNLEVIDLTTRQVVRTIPLGGQPDSIAVSPDGRYAAICIENERDEDLGSGEPPQLPAGFLVIVDLVGDPDQWTTRTVELTGLADLFPEDPEPEYVDISAANIAAVTLQENNHLAFVYLPTGQVFGDYTAGTADLELVDVLENDLIEQVASLSDVPREPDAITWTGPFGFATADEGDLFGGSRGFTTWSVFGAPTFEAGNTLEHLAARLGHYPENRSENKGVEPEAVEFAEYSGDRFLFVGSERANLVFVYQQVPQPVPGVLAPVLRQVLPTGVAPEGLLAIPERDLFVVACEDDARDDGIRASIMIYERTGGSTYPTLLSADRDDTGVPIPWAALSGLAADATDAGTAYTVHDSFYRASRIYTIDLTQPTPLITAETALVDTDGVLRNALEALKAALPATATADFDVDALVEADGRVNLDLEGVALAPSGNFWVCHEGRGNLVAGVSDPSDRPFESPNAVLEVAPDGTILRAVLPPQSVTENQFRFGLEGIAVDGDAVYASWQRAWTAAGDPADRARLGRYDLATDTWTFAYYPLDAVASANGGWIGQADTTALGAGAFAILERDNQAGPDAAVKRVYTVETAGVAFADAAAAPNFPVLAKSLVSDFLVDGTFEPFAGFTPEKIEGFTVLPGGDALLVNDNDGVDDNSGETLLIRLDGLFR